MKKILMSGFLMTALILTSCNWLDINVDPNFPVEASTEALLSSGIYTSAGITGGEMHLVGSCWTQHYTQNNNSSQYMSMVNYSILNTSYPRFWSTPYAVALPDLALVIKQGEAENKPNCVMIAKIMTAFDYYLLTSWFDAIPFTEALQGVANLNPKYDESKTIVFPGIIAMLDEAIAMKSAASAIEITIAFKDADLIYAGDIDKWTKFAKTIKLKMLMYDFDANKAAIQSLLNENDLLTADAGIIGKYTDATNKDNPLYESDRRALNYKNNLTACKTLVEYLRANNDPRLPIFYNGITNNASGNPVGSIIGFDYGIRPTSTVAPSGTISIAKIEATDNVYLMSAADSYFTQAEVWARLSDDAKSKTAYEDGVKAAFTLWKLDGSSFIAPGGAYEYTGTNLDERMTQIMTQKWVASARAQAWSAFFDRNRTGYPVIGKTYFGDAGYVLGQFTPNKASALPYPQRMIYQNGSLNYNSNAPKDPPAIDAKIWWQK